MSRSILILSGNTHFVRPCIGVLREDSVTHAATQEACACFRQQIFTKQRAKENVSLHKNKVGGKGLWKCCCAEFGGCLCFMFSILIQFGIYWAPK